MRESGAVRADRTGPARAGGGLAFRLVRVGESFAPLLGLFEAAHSVMRLGWASGSDWSAGRAFEVVRGSAAYVMRYGFGIGGLGPTLRSLCFRHVISGLGALIVMQGTSAVAEDVRQGPLQEFIIDLSGSLDSSGHLDPTFMDCITVVESSEGADILECQHKATGIRSLRIPETGSDNLSISILYSRNQDSDVGAVSEDGDLLVSGPTDLVHWGTEIEVARRLLRENGLFECSIDDTGSNSDHPGRILFGTQNRHSGSRILFLYSNVDGKLPKEFNWATMSEGQILATILIFNQLATPCSTLD